MAAHYLEFERPIADLELKIEELSKLSDTAGPGAFDAEIEARQREVAASRGFSLQEHALSLYAVCKRENCEHRPAPKVNVRHL